MKFKMMLVLLLLSLSIIAFARIRGEIREIAEEMSEKINARDGSCAVLRHGRSVGAARVSISENDDTSYHISVDCISMISESEIDHYLGTIIDVVYKTLRRERFRVKTMHIDQYDKVTWSVDIRHLRKVRKIKDPVKKSRFLRKKGLLYRF